MENTNEKTISALNGLIEINNDRAEGYQKASETAHPELKELFLDYSRQSSNNLPRLKTEVQRLGGKPATGNTTAGAFYHAWMDVKTAIMGKADGQSIINLCEFGEDAAVKAYDDALKTEGLESVAQKVISEQRSEIKSSHDRISSLKKEEEARH